MEINDNPCTSKKKTVQSHSKDALCTDTHTVRYDWNNGVKNFIFGRNCVLFVRFIALGTLHFTLVLLVCVCLCVCMMEESGDDVMPYQEMVPNAN